MRSAPTTFPWVKGHSGTEGNEGADQLASEGAAKQDTGEINAGQTIPNRWNLTGTKLEPSHPHTEDSLPGHPRQEGGSPATTRRSD